jgi:D-alanyl-D-alanine carboxypeptidase (penicillin-binding protein 5/6)
VLAIAALGYVVFALVRSVPQPVVQAAPLPRALAGRAHALAWPPHGQAAVAVQGIGLIGAHATVRATPIASLAKVMTAYQVLRDHPLAGGTGPLITVRPSDVAVYRADLAAGGSVVAVRAGERLTELQALEGLLLPSGNNIATLLARWDAAGEPAFVARMNAQARTLGLLHTHYADASGVQAATVSTAGDQVRLAMSALDEPALRRIVAMRQATLPVAGLQFNLDPSVGKDGIFGVKTGFTPQAGGCFLFAAHARVAGRTVTIVGAVLAQPSAGNTASTIAATARAATALLASARGILSRTQVVRRGETLAWAHAPWAARVALQAASSASLLGWPGLHVQSTITATRSAAPIAAGQPVGTALLVAGAQRARVGLVAAGALPNASLSWRLQHP